MSNVERAYRACEQITRAQAVNFFYGMRLLPAPKRQAMYAVYAFARRVDDVGDGDLPCDEKLGRLEGERSTLTWNGAVDDPVMVALRDSHQRFSLPLDALVSLIDGVEADARGTTYESFDQLVGVLPPGGGLDREALARDLRNRSLGDRLPLADDLGVAMQLTNILRDVREDAGRGRVYLPREELERFGCQPGPLAGSEPARAELLRFQAARNRAWFDRGLELLPLLDARSAACVAAMTGIYRRISTGCASPRRWRAAGSRFLPGGRAGSPRRRWASAPRAPCEPPARSRRRLLALRRHRSE